MEESQTPEIEPQENNQENKNIESVKQQDNKKQEKPVKKQQKSKKQTKKQESYDEYSEQQDEDIDFSSQSSQENETLTSQQFNIDIDKSGLQLSQLTKSSEKQLSMSSQSGIFVPKILKESQDYSQVVQQASDLNKKQVYVQNEISDELQQMLDKKQVQILYNIREISQGVCLFASTISRSAKYLCCLIVGLPIFQCKNVITQNSSQTFKLQLLQPTVQQVRQLFADDKEFKIAEFDQIQLSQQYYINRLNAQQRILIFSEKSLNLLFDKDDEDPNTFGFIFYLQLLNFQIYMILNEKNKSTKEFIINNKIKRKHIKFIYSDDTYEEVQKIVSKNIDKDLKPIFLYNNYKIDEQFKQLDIILLKKVKLIESAFIGKFTFEK